MHKVVAGVRFGGGRRTESRSLYNVIPPYMVAVSQESRLVCKYTDRDADDVIRRCVGVTKNTPRGLDTPGVCMQQAQLRPLVLTHNLVVVT